MHSLLSLVDSKILMDSEGDWSTVAQNYIRGAQEFVPGFQSLGAATICY